MIRALFDANPALEHGILTGFMWGSYLAFPFLLWLLYVGYRSVWGFLRVTPNTPRSPWYHVFGRLFGAMLWGVFMVLTISFLYARFYERFDLQVRYHTLDLPQLSGKRIVMWADPHLGVLKGSDWLQEVVEQVNAQDPDLILIPGDFTFSPRVEDLDDLFAPFQAFEAPVYAVLGNHDLPSDRDVPTTSIIDALQPYDMNIIDEKVLQHRFEDGQDCWFIGVGDKWNYAFNPSLWGEIPRTADCRIVITHDPDSYVFIRDWDLPADLTVAGHTHGGQVWLPFLDMRHIIPTDYAFVQGWYTATTTDGIWAPVQTDGNQGDILITPGVGETLLPLRLGVKPTIEVIDIQ